MLYSICNVPVFEVCKVFSNSLAKLEHYCYVLGTFDKGLEMLLKFRVLLDQDACFGNKSRFTHLSRVSKCGHILFQTFQTFSRLNKSIVARSFEIIVVMSLFVVLHVQRDSAVLDAVPKYGIISTSWRFPKRIATTHHRIPCICVYLGTSRFLAIFWTSVFSSRSERTSLRFVRVQLSKRLVPFLLVKRISLCTIGFSTIIRAMNVYILILLFCMSEIRYFFSGTPFFFLTHV